MRRRRGGRWSWVALGFVLAVAGVIGATQLGGGSRLIDPVEDSVPPAEADGRATALEPTGTGSEETNRYVVVSSESQAHYRVSETFFNFNREAVAVGITGAVSGEFSLAVGSGPVTGMIRADISQLTSDEPRRDQAIRDRWLQSRQFPIAEFRPTAIELPAVYTEGQEIPTTVRGELTIRDVTRPSVWTGSLVVEGAGLRATLSTEIRMTDYGFEPPSILGMLRAEDEATLEVEIVARRAAG